MNKKTLTQTETAKLLGVSINTLYKLRENKKGPKYYSTGIFPAYLRADVLRYKRRHIDTNSAKGIEDIPDYMLTTDELASFLGLHKQTLINWRRDYDIEKRGPAFKRIGRRVRYSPDDVKEYLNNL